VADADARILRLQQGTVTVVLLAGFVFQIQWMIPAAAVLPGLDAALGTSGPTARFWRAAIAPRAGPPERFDTAEVARDQALLVFSALIVATLLALADVGVLAALLAFVVAGVSALAATGLFCVSAELHRRRGGGERGGGRPRPPSGR
jgi:Domain of unknown function (DUF4395)